MSEKKSYSEKLRDPRWQKKRLEILSRDEWTCQFCGDKESTLNVHHLIYEQNKNPWEYQDYFLITLCEGCHESESISRREVEEKLLYILKVCCADIMILDSIACDLSMLIGEGTIKNKALEFIKLFKKNLAETTKQK